MEQVEEEISSCQPTNPCSTRKWLLTGGCACVCTVHVSLDQYLQQTVHLHNSVNLHTNSVEQELQMIKMQVT